MHVVMISEISPQHISIIVNIRFTLLLFFISQTKHLSKRNSNILKIVIITHIKLYSHTVLEEMIKKLV